MFADVPKAAASGTAGGPPLPQQQQQQQQPLLGGQPHGMEEASQSHLDLFRVPYGLYRVKYIDLVSLPVKASQS